jgi:2-polyprenyl-6-methoxyphenol hydroxylase-like FAD-dependent oxidoreductase
MDQMNRKTTTSHDQHKPFGRAVVIGGSIAGLTAARVLSDYFERVTIIERDRLPELAEFRRGTPQARHAHILPLRGQMILEQQFPGLVEELAANGAISIDGSSEMAFFIAGGWHEVRHHTAAVSTTCSRPLLETTIYRRLAQQDDVQIIQEHEVTGLEVDEQGERVTGVRLRRRWDVQAGETGMAADLVVDTSGRESRAPAWLAGLGYTPPRESVVNSFPGYATRIYRRPAEFSEPWKIIYIRPTPPDSFRGGLIIPIEGGRWQVTLVGMSRDYPPTDEEGFLEFARSLPTPKLYEAIKAAEPLTRPCGYRRTENRLRHYEQLPRYLEGFLAGGDAACALNPVYALGMTAAALTGQALAGSLKTQRPGDVAGLAQTFQQALHQVVAGPWQMATREDRRWPATEVAESLVSVRLQVPGRRFMPAPALRRPRQSSNVYHFA